MSDPDEFDSEDAQPVGPIDFEGLQRIGARLAGTSRFSSVEFRPAYAPDPVVVDYDRGYFPAGVQRAHLRIRWFETDDFNVHYSEQYADGEVWECRWDRHPNDHNTRDHFHPPPAAVTPGTDADYPDGWRDVVSRTMGALDERIESFWD